MHIITVVYSVQVVHDDISMCYFYNFKLIMWILRKLRFTDLSFGRYQPIFPINVHSFEYLRYMYTSN